MILDTVLPIAKDKLKKSLFHSTFEGAADFGFNSKTLDGMEDCVSSIVFISSLQVMAFVS